MYTSTPYYMYIVIILMTTATPNGLIVWPTTPTTHNLLHDLVDPLGGPDYCFDRWAYIYINFGFFQPN